MQKRVTQCSLEQIIMSEEFDLRRHHFPGGNTFSVDGLTNISTIK